MAQHSHTNFYENSYHISYQNSITINGNLIKIAQSVDLLSP